MKADQLWLAPDLAAYSTVLSRYTVGAPRVRSLIDVPDVTHSVISAA